MMIMMMGSSRDGEDGHQAPPPLVMRAPQQALTPNHFVFGKLLGLGSYSKVMKVKRKDTGEIFALKVMDKKHIIRENKVNLVKMERMILDQLDFPGIIRLCFTFQDSYSLYMGLECCDGGELFDQIRRKGRMKQEEVCFYAAEIVDILEYIHSQGVIHRDLKPENLLLTSDGHLKLCDFGSAKMVRPLANGFFQPEPGEKMSNFVGTAEYVSPEVLTGKPVDYGVDLWALGCIIYQMLEGRPPFKAATEYLTFQKVMACEFTMPSHFSSEAQDLVNHLLDLKPEKRLGSQGLDKLKNHSFFKGADWLELRKLSAPTLTVAPKGVSTQDSDEGSADSEWDIAIGSNFSDLSVADLSSGSSSPVGSPSDLNTNHPSLSPAPKRFLEPGEKLVATAMVKKRKNLMTKKLQLLLIDKPRLIYVDPVKLVVVGEIPWSRQLQVKVESQFKWKIVVPNRTYDLEDLRGQAWQWKTAIEELQNQHPLYSSASKG
ncbi:unnamed protein product [Sphagnum compactum]